MNKRKSLYNKVTPVFDFASLYPSTIKSFAGSTNPDIRKVIRKYKLSKIFRSQA